MYVYDEQVTPYLEGNLAPLEDNETHGTVRRLDSYQQHIVDFINEDKSTNSAMRLVILNSFIRTRSE